MTNEKVYKEMYEEIGKNCDVNKLLHVYNYPYIEYIKKHLHNGKILAVGCGPGVDMAKIGLTKFIGVDISFNFLNKGKKIFKTPTFINGSASSLPFKNNSFDTVICLEAIEHVLNYKLALQELVRVLKHGGQLIIATPNRHRWWCMPVRYVIPEELREKIVSAIGLSKGKKTVLHQHVHEFSFFELKHELRTLGIKNIKIKGFSFALTELLFRVLRRIKKIEKKTSFEKCIERNIFLPDILKKYFVVIGKK